MGKTLVRLPEKKSLKVLGERRSKMASNETRGSLQGKARKALSPSQGGEGKVSVAYQKKAEPGNRGLADEGSHPWLGGAVGGISLSTEGRKISSPAK